MLEPMLEARAPRAVSSGAALLVMLGLSILACTLSDDFSPRRIDVPQEIVAESTGMPTGSVCADPHGCCASSPDCNSPEVCVSGSCQVPSDCAALDDPSVCPIELCPGPHCPTSTAIESCSDGLRNGSESGVDCGGSCPTPCTSPAPESCSDNRRDQDETGVDCGGNCVTDCVAGQGCRVDGDCSPSLLCSPSSHVCAAISCADGRQDGDEILVDCGGGTCPGCPVGTACVDATDCNSGICALGTCRTSPLCGDAELDGDETDVDCGGSDPNCQRCADGDSCQGNADCARGGCAQGTCISCQDGTRNGTETAADCGGPDLSCHRCAVDQACALNRDCQTGTCTGGVCVNFSCSDGQQNGTETGADCGGSGAGCARCSDGLGCRLASDCASGACAEGVCISCADGRRNGTETDADCGGTNGACGRCAPGLLCLVDGDCSSGACEGGRCCGGSTGDCTRCAERLSPTVDCDVPQAGQDSTGVSICRSFLQCLASNPAICPTRDAAGCSGDDQVNDACPHNNYGGNAGTGLTRVNQVLQNAGCQL
jgi:hypothetical protein